MSKATQLQVDKKRKSNNALSSTHSKGATSANQGIFLDGCKVEQKSTKAAFVASSASKRKQVVFSKTCSQGFMQLRETALVSPEQPHHDQQDASSEK